MAGTEFGEGGGGLGQRESGVDDGFDFPGGGPIEGGDDVGAVAAVAADEALLFHEERPKVQANFASGGGAAGDDGAVAGETFEAFEQDVAADVFDDNIHATLVGEFADFGGPGGVVGIHYEIDTEIFGKGTFGVGRGGGDDVGAELFGDLDGGGADAAGSADDEDPIAGAYLSAMGEHVHGRTTGEREGGAGIEIHAVRQADEGAGGNDDAFGEATITIDAEQFATDADGFLALFTEFAFTAKDAGLHSDGVAHKPIFYMAAEFQNTSGHFAAGGARQGNFYGETGFFEPEVKVIDAAGVDLHDDFIRRGMGSGDVA